MERVEKAVPSTDDADAAGKQNSDGNGPAAPKYKVKIDHDHYDFDERFVSGRALLEKAGKTPVENYEIEKRVKGGQYVPVELDETVDLAEPGVEAFETFPLDETEG